MLYPIIVTPENNNTVFSVTFPGVRGCFSSGDSLVDALVNAKEALVIHLEQLIADGQSLPAPYLVNVDSEYPTICNSVMSLIEIDLANLLSNAYQTSTSA